MNISRRIPLVLVLLLVLGGAVPLLAQGVDPREEMKQRMDEIARLMRESERALLDIGRLGRLIEEQAEIVRKLKELEPPPSEGTPPEGTPPEGTPPEEASPEREKLRQRHQEITERLARLFESQKQSSSETSRMIEALLRSLPEGPGGQGEGEPKEPKSQRQREEEQRRLKEQEEKRQEAAREDPQGKQQEKEPQEGNGQKPASDTESAAQQRRVQAWIARLPPEIQERLNRNDYSAIPARYQRLVREITALRAKREAEETTPR